MTNRTDSRQLAELRFQFHREYHRKGEPAPRASPERLGRHARDTGVQITDFGAHSVRWRNRFLSSAK